MNNKNRRVEAGNRPSPANSHSQLTLQQQYQGVIPPPALLKEFDEVVPGTAQRLIAWSEAEQKHRHHLEQQVQEANIRAQARQLEVHTYQSRANFRSEALGQVVGFIVSGGCVAGAIWLGITGHEWAAAALCAIPTVAMIQAFRLSRVGRPKT